MFEFNCIFTLLVYSFSCLLLVMVSNDFVTQHNTCLDAGREGQTCISVPLSLQKMLKPWPLQLNSQKSAYSSLHTVAVVALGWYCHNFRALRNLSLPITITVGRFASNKLRYPCCLGSWRCGDGRETARKVPTSLQSVELDIFWAVLLSELTDCIFIGCPMILLLEQPFLKLLLYASPSVTM